MGDPAILTIRCIPEMIRQAAPSPLSIASNDPSNSKRLVRLMGKGIKPAAGIADEGYLSTHLKVEAQPNPVGDNGRLVVNVPTPGDVNVSLYDIYGYKVADLFNAASPAGELAVPFESTPFPNGIYYCIVKTSERKAYCEFTIAK